MLLLIIFSTVALFLAVIGVYGVLAYTVAQRRREMGIRMALGSSTRTIFLLVLRHGLRVTAVGVLGGAAAALFLGRFIQSLLFGIEPLDAGVLAAAATLLASVALAACVIPALQATRVNPVRVMTGE
jgi:ABC-type antimicrobial peptide transport system permease subunit